MRNQTRRIQWGDEWEQRVKARLRGGTTNTKGIFKVIWKLITIKAS